MPSVSFHERDERLHVARSLKESGIHDQSTAHADLKIVARTSQSRVAVVVHLRAAHGGVMVGLGTAVSFASDDVEPVFIVALSCVVVYEPVHVPLEAVLSPALSVLEDDSLLGDDLREVRRYVSELLGAVVASVSEVVAELLIEGDDVLRRLDEHAVHAFEDGLLVHEGVLVGVGLDFRSVYVHVFSGYVHFIDEMHRHLIVDFLDVPCEIVCHETLEGHEAGLSFLGEPDESDVMGAQILHPSKRWLAVLHVGEKNRLKQSDVVVSLSSSGLALLQVLRKVNSSYRFQEREHLIIFIKDILKIEWQTQLI